MKDREWLDEAMIRQRVTEFVAGLQGTEDEIVAGSILFDVTQIENLTLLRGIRGDTVRTVAAFVDAAGMAKGTNWFYRTEQLKAVTKPVSPVSVAPLPYELPTRGPDVWEEEQERFAALVVTVHSARKTLQFAVTKTTVHRLII